MVEIIEILHEHQSKSELIRNECITCVIFFISPNNFLLTDTFYDVMMLIFTVLTFLIKKLKKKNTNSNIWRSVTSK